MSEVEVGQLKVHGKLPCGDAPLRASDVIQPRHWGAGHTKTLDRRWPSEANVSKLPEKKNFLPVTRPTLGESALGSALRV